jgi:transposase
MFARIKKSGKYEYLQIVENRRDSGKPRQHVIATVGRMDRLKIKGDVETLIRSLSRFSDKVLLVLSERSQPHASAKKIGPSLICERLWQQLRISSVIQELVAHRKYRFDVERAIFLTVLHRLFVSGSDRSCDRWHRDYRIAGVDNLQLHHLYRAMAFLGEETDDADEDDETVPLSPRCIKDRIEEQLFDNRRDLFSGLDFVFFDTTSIYFEGNGGSSLGHKGFSKDHRPDLNQMVVGAVLDNMGNPICCEMWPGNTADVNTLIPVTKRIRDRFGVGQFCLLADRGMISTRNRQHLDKHKISYILGARMRRVNEIKHDVLADTGDYQEIYAESPRSSDPSSLKVKEVMVNGRHYIVCLNEKQARKDAADRQAIVESLDAQLKKNPKALVGNKGYRQYVKLDKGHLHIDQQKIDDDARYDGKWVLQTNTSLPADEVALKYKELWQVEHVFRDMKSVLDTRPVFHQRDETIRGHVFCSFLALVLRKELDRRLETAGHVFEWADVKQDLRALQEIFIEDNGKSLAIRSECLGVCGKVFQAVGVALPPTISEL